MKQLARQHKQAPTPAEDKLWEWLRGNQIEGFKFRRQHPIERFIVDFYSAKRSLVIEVDGEIHQYTQVRGRDSGKIFSKNSVYGLFVSLMTRFCTIFKLCLSSIAILYTSSWLRRPSLLSPP